MALGVRGAPPDQWDPSTRSGSDPWVRSAGILGSVTCLSDVGREAERLCARLLSGGTHRTRAHGLLQPRLLHPNSHWTGVPHFTCPATASPSGIRHRDSSVPAWNRRPLHFQPRPGLCARTMLNKAFFGHFCTILSPFRPIWGQFWCHSFLLPHPLSLWHISMRFWPS